MSEGPSDAGAVGPGTALDGFVIESVAGRGGMGVVYRARQRRPDRVVALKVIATDLADAPAFRARFQRESAIAAQIEHPNVIPVYAVGEAGGVLYIAMRFVEGIDLRTLLADAGRLAPERAASIVDQVAPPRPGRRRSRPGRPRRRRRRRRPSPPCPAARDAGRSPPRAPWRSPWRSSC